MAASPPLQATSGDVEALRAELRAALVRIEALERVPAGLQVQTTDFSPRPGQIITAEPPPEGLGVLLPAARPQIRNARITVSARNANPIRWEAVGGTVNGVRMVTSNAVGIVEAVCDGAAWHISQGAASTTGSAASTAGATYFLETADTGLPNARVGTDSTEIDVDYTVGSVVSWALRSASVVFSKLQNLTGLSVLGRAANSTGVMAAVTATAARQVLRVNDGGTELEWGNPVAVWSPDGTDQGDFHTLDLRQQTSIVVDGGAFTGRWQVRLKRAALTGAIEAGEDENGTKFAVAAIGDGLSLAPDQLSISVDGAALAGAGLDSFGAVLFVGAGDGIDVATDTVAVDVSDLVGTGLEDDGSNNLRIAASAAGDGLTGGGGSALAVGAGTGITVSANAVAVSIPLTDGDKGDITVASSGTAWTIDSDAVTNAKLANMATSRIKGRATALTGDPEDLTISQVLDMANSTNGAVLTRRSFNAWAEVPSQANGFHLITDGSGLATWASVTGPLGTLSQGSTGVLEVVADADLDMSTGDGSGVGFSRSMTRCLFWDDFCSVEGATFSVGAFGAIVCDTGWIVTNNAGGTATISAVDGGSGGPSNAPGQLQISTSATTGTQIDLTKGNNNTCRWLRASDVKSLKFRLAIPTTTSVHVTFGLNDGSFGSTDCARFDYDSSVDTTLHVISANSGGATLTNTDLNVTPGTAMHEYEIRSPSASSPNWEFYRDGSLVATQTTTSKTRGVNVHISIANLTASDRTIRIDYCSLETWKLSR